MIAFIQNSHELIAMRPFIEKQLCTPLDPAVRYTPFFYGQLPGDKRVFSLRPFSVPGDLPSIYNWLNGYSGRLEKDAISPVQQLLEAYHDLLTSDYSQSFIAEVEDIPVLQLDIVRADQDEISLKQIIREGDYSLHFLFSPHVNEPMSFFAAALSNCLHSFFTFAGIRRIYCKAYYFDDRSNLLLKEAGFVLDKTVKDYPGAINIYRYERLVAVT